MEKKYSCAVVRDLLTLYRDNTTSEESNGIITDHLQECEECQKYLKCISENKDKQTEKKETQRFYTIAKKIRHRKIKLSIFLICLFLISIIGTLKITSIITVMGNSMEPTISNGDKFLINKIIYKVKKPERFDIIVYKDIDGNLLIKRIVGLPGETIQIKEGKIYINGEPLNNSDINSGISESGIIKEPLKIENNEYFVLGDNYDNSKDSRNDPNGLVKENSIIGRVKK